MKIETDTAAELRREARRQRILQNSDNRLRKIKGDYSEPEAREQYDSPKNENAFTAHSNARPAKNLDALVNDIKEESLEDTPPVWQPVISEDDEFPIGTAKHSTQQHMSFVHMLFNVKVHVFLLAIFVRIILLMDMGYIFGNMILVPLFVVQLSMILFPRGYAAANNSSQGLLGAALMLSGLPQSKTHTLLKTVATLKDIGTNLAFYLFTFFVTHAIVIAI